MLLPLLKPVSRSLYTTFRALPEPVRDTLALGYLFCRAADAIADTPGLSPAQRLRLLETFWNAWDSPQGIMSFGGLDAAIHAADPGARALVHGLPGIFMTHEALPGDERALIRDVVAGVLEGLRSELLGTVKEVADLERYCSFIGGKPAEFSARLCVLRLGLGGVDTAAFVAAKLQLGQGVVMASVQRGEKWSVGREAAWKAAAAVTQG